MKRTLSISVTNTLKGRPITIDRVAHDTETCSVSITAGPEQLTLTVDDDGQWRLTNVVDTLASGVVPR